MSVFVLVCVCVCMGECVCVWVREREKERERLLLRDAAQTCCKTRHVIPLRHPRLETLAANLIKICTLVKY